MSSGTAFTKLLSAFDSVCILIKQPSVGFLVFSAEQNHNLTRQRRISPNSFCWYGVYKLYEKSAQCWIAWFPPISFRNVPFFWNRKPNSILIFELSPQHSSFLFPSSEEVYSSRRVHRNHLSSKPHFHRKNFFPSEVSLESSSVLKNSKHFLLNFIICTKKSEDDIEARNRSRHKKQINGNLKRKCRHNHYLKSKFPHIWSRKSVEHRKAIDS